MNAHASHRRFELAETLAEVGHILRTYKRRVDPTVSPRDEMFTGDKNGYLTVGYSAFALIAQAMLLAARTSPTRILDLPCGHGRVLRMRELHFQVWRLSHAISIVMPSSSVHSHSAQFQSTLIHIRPGVRLQITSTSSGVDLSLLMLIPIGPAGSLADHVEHDGLLILTTHGRAVLTRGTPGNKRWERTVHGYLADGFGYEDRTGTVGWGTSITKPSWIIELLSCRDDLSLLTHVERGGTTIQTSSRLSSQPSITVRVSG